LIFGGLYFDEGDENLRRMLVTGRAADWTKAREKLGWNPQFSLEEGFRITYEWAEKKLKE
jgi:nucleoside-diphosphate-sugar epimerase